MGGFDDRGGQKRSVHLKSKCTLIMLVIFGVISIFSAFSVNHVRRFMFSDLDLSAMTVTTDPFARMVDSSWVLFLDR